MQNKKHWMSCKDKFKIQGTVSISAKWQIVIPKSVRDILWVESWDDMVAITKWDKAVIFIKSNILWEFIEYAKEHIGDDIIDNN